MSEPDIEEHLTALGVPPHVATYVAEHKPLRIPSLGGFGQIAVMIAGFAVGGFWLWPLLEAQLEQNARMAAEVTGALLYHHNFGVGLLIAVFGWIGLSSVIVGAIPILSRRLSVGVFYDSIVGAATAGDTLSGRRARWGVEKLMRELEDEQDPERYVWRVSFAWLKPAVLASVVVAAIAAIVTLRELHTYTLFLPDGYEQRHTFMPSPTIGRWTDAARVEVGCNHVTGRNSSDEPVYDIHMKDGRSIRIDGATPISGSWIDQVEKIDAELVAAGARFEAWSWLNRDAYAPQCLTAQAIVLGADDFERLRRLIRASRPQ